MINQSRVAVVIAFVLGVFIGLLANHQAEAGSTDAWDSWDVKQVISLLEKIEENTRK